MKVLLNSFHLNGHTLGLHPLNSKFKPFQSSFDSIFFLFSSAPLIITIITIRTSIDTAETDHDPAPAQGRETTRKRSEGLERRVRRRKKPWYRSAARNTESKQAIQLSKYTKEVKYVRCDWLRGVCLKRF